MATDRRMGTGKALLIALAGFTSLSIGDAVVKTMSGAWPGSAVAALRYCFAALGLAALVALRYGKAGFVFPKPWLQLGRGAAVALATLGFFLGVMRMPLADATAIQFTSPIMTAIVAGLVLHERVPRAGWAAIAVAFAGVLIVLRPNFLELGGAALYPVGAAFGMAWLITFNRKSAGIAPVLVMQFTLALVAAPLLLGSAFVLDAVGGSGFAIGHPSGEVVLKCALIAMTATTGHMLIYWATVHAGAALVSPMTYVQLIAAAALGWAWFGDAPDAVSLGGAALIILGGLLLWRAQKRPPEPEGTPD